MDNSMASNIEIFDVAKWIQYNTESVNQSGGIKYPKNNFKADGKGKKECAKISSIKDTGNGWYNNG